MMELALAPPSTQHVHSADAHQRVTSGKKAETSNNGSLPVDNKLYLHKWLTAHCEYNILIVKKRETHPFKWMRSY
jgi:hypothetical protein